MRVSLTHNVSPQQSFYINHILINLSSNFKAVQRCYSCNKDLKQQVIISLFNQFALYVSGRRSKGRSSVVHVTSLNLI